MSQSAQLLTGCVELTPGTRAQRCLEGLADRLHVEHTFGVPPVRRVNLDG